MPINLTLIEVKQQPLSYSEMDGNFKELANKLAPLDSPVFRGAPRVPIPGNNADPGQIASVGYVNQLITGSQAQGNLSYASLGAKNVFTQPQIVGDATANNEAVTYSQLLQRGFQAGDLKWSLWHQALNSGWVNLAGQLLPDPNSLDVNKGLYADLFSKIGYGYGGSAAEKAFRVPDCKGRVPISATNNTGVTPGLSARNAGASGGEEFHFLQYNEMVDHQHNFSVAVASQIGVNQGGGLGLINQIGSYRSDPTTGMLSKGGQTPFNVMPPFLCIYLLCKL